MTDLDPLEMAPLDPDVVAGRAIRAQREVLRLTQKELVERLKSRGWSLDATAITRIENGTRSLRVPQIYAISEALEMEPAGLFFDEAADVGNMRLDASHNIKGARRSLVKALEQFEQISDRTIPEPGLLADSGLHDVAPEGYLTYVHRRVQEWATSEDAPHIVIHHEERREALLAIAAALIDDLCTLWTSTNEEQTSFSVEPPERPRDRGSILG